MSFQTGVCNFCGTGCGHLLKVTEGRIDSVFVSQNHPISKGRLCVRGWHIHELLRSGDRIVEPLIKKDGSLQKATYDEALALAVKKLKSEVTSPAEEIAFIASPRSSNEENYLLAKLARGVLGTNNIGIASDSGERSALNVMYRGTGMAGPSGSIEDIAKTDFILVVGTDLAKQNPIIGSEIHKAARAGATLVTVSPRKSQMAKLSRTHLQVRAGSRKILLAAMAKAMIEENCHDLDFIQKYTDGFEGFANSLGSLKAEDVKSLTGLDFAEVKKTACELARAKSAMAFFTAGIAGMDEETIASIHNLFLVAGKIGREGCGVVPVTGICNLQGSYDMGVAPDLLPGFQALSDQGARDKVSKAWGAQIPADAGKTAFDLLKDRNSRLKCLVVVDHDDGIIRYADRIKKLDCVIYLGSFKNPFSELATVVIPTASYVETDGTFTNTDRRIQLSRTKIDAPSGVQPLWKVLAGLADKAGAKWGYASPADVMDEIAKVTPSYAKVSHGMFKGIAGVQWPCDDKNPGGTPRYSIEKAGGKAKFVTAAQETKTDKQSEKYPFALVPGTAMHYWHQNNLMRRTFIPMREYNATLLLFPKGYIELCADDAKKLGVREKWPVKVSSPYGTMTVAVRISNEVLPDTAYIPYFIQDMIPDFLVAHGEIMDKGEEAIIPVSIEKV